MDRSRKRILAWAMGVVGAVVLAGVLLVGVLLLYAGHDSSIRIEQIDIGDEVVPELDQAALRDSPVLAQALEQAATSGSWRSGKSSDVDEICGVLKRQFRGCSVAFCYLDLCYGVRLTTE